MARLMLNKPMAVGKKRHLDEASLKVYGLKSIT